MKYDHVFAEVFNKPWAILPDKLATIAQLVSLRAAGGKFTEEEIHARLDQASISNGPRTQQNNGTVAVIPIRGVISQRMNLMTQISGGTSIEKLTGQFRQALSDRTVTAIVFDVDSPGGGVDGVPELADEIYKSRGQKKSIAVANSTAASAAYWLAASAGELVVIPSGQVGSIGVYAAHEDVSEAMQQAGVKVSFISAGKFKVDGNEFEPLSDSARADMQKKVDCFYDMFASSVGRGRRASAADVRGAFGQGRMVLAAQAVKERMADRVATMDEVIGRLTGTITVAGSPTRGSASLAAADGSSSPRKSIEQMRRELDILSAGDDPRPDRLSLEERRRQLDRPRLEERRRQLDRSSLEERRRQLDRPTE